MITTYNIGMLGCGNIGCGVLQLLHEYSQNQTPLSGIDFVVRHILVRDVTRIRSPYIPEGALTTCAEDVTRAADVDVVIECMGGEHPASDLMLDALENGKSVVTANKMALALHFDALDQAAKRNHVHLSYEASVGGAMPIINMLMTSLQANKIDHLTAIINGTTNYILTQMFQNGTTYADALKDAQQLGFAEPDPTADVEGEDAAYKLSIMATLAFHQHLPVNAISREGMTGVMPLDISFARQFGFQIKLLACAWCQDGAYGSVAPALVSDSHPLSFVQGSFNAVYLHGHACGDMMIYGRGAGSAPTASAIVSDVINTVLRAPVYPDFLRTDGQDNAHRTVSRWYIRLAAPKTDVLDQAVCFLHDQAIDIEKQAMMSDEQNGGVHIAFLIKPTPDDQVHNAVNGLRQYAVDVMNLFRVEE